LHDDAVPIDVSLLAAESVVVDLVYRPNETAFVRAARARGHRSIDGRAMLVEQGAIAFERWFGVSPDRDVMWRAVTQD
jgi:shikimate dehydrogenase